MAKFCNDERHQEACQLPCLACIEEGCRPCFECDSPMPFEIEEAAMYETHHHCTSCNAWQFGSGSGFDGHICNACVQKEKQ